MRVAVRVLRAGLVDLANENWRLDALCIEYPDLDWFPTSGASVDPGRAVCGRCLVRQECLTFALSAPDTRRARPREAQRDGTSLGAACSRLVGGRYQSLTRGEILHRSM